MIKTILSTIALLVVASPILGIKNFVLISAPGSGKGTFSQYFIQKHGYIQVCPGDIFRSEISAQTKLGKYIQPAVERGDYVDESIVCQLIADNLSHIIKQNKPFIIDGFPRSAVSFQFLLTFFQENNLMEDVCFIQLIASDATCIKRILGRQICTKCCKVYNVESAQPKDPNKCDDCGINLITRTADTQGIAKSRLEYFHANIEHLMLLAASLYETQEIYSECSLKTLHSKYDKLFEASL